MRSKAVKTAIIMTHSLQTLMLRLGRQWHFPPSSTVRICNLFAYLLSVYLVFAIYFVTREHAFALFLFFKRIGADCISSRRLRCDTVVSSCIIITIFRPSYHVITRSFLLRRIQHTSTCIRAIGPYQNHWLMQHHRLRRGKVIRPR